MDESQRWSVMYTNHVRQKRKVYHDGFLVVQSSRNKVTLYDECDTVLETRFVKKDDLIRSGETITFASYLVDLTELCKGHQTSSILNSQEKDRKVSDTSSSLYSYNSQNRKPMVGKIKGRLVNLSPSQKMIRDFKKNEVSKFGSSPNCMDMTNLSTKEWQVLYTTQLTQKAKKFHDGFLQLIACGSQGRQVKLYDTNKRHLDSRFLKRDETVCSGGSLILEGHLVQIGDQEEDHKPPTDLNVQGKNCKVVGKNDMADYQAKIPTNKLAAGKTPGNTSQRTLTKISDSSYKTENAKLSCRDAEPKRSVHDILSILRQPCERKVVVVKVEDCAESHSSEFQSGTKNHVKECAEDCSETTREQFREKRSEHDSMIKVIKSEAVEVVVLDAEECAVSEKGRESQARSSSFRPRSQAPGFISPIHGVQCTNHEMMSSSFSLESHAAVTAALNCESQKEIKSEYLNRSYKSNEDKTCSSEEIVTETNAAVANGLRSSKLPEEDKNVLNVGHYNDCTSHNLSGLKDTTLKQDLYTNDMDEFPSFDLGI